ncbi:methyltransferase domain-containing protein [Estrella lausannensis]|uniref:Methyltransferase domain-containing protein n=1 Tax=Estrella lausannensis TaxID=483423 RepID=A0A0H5DQP2_9BACT|nr:methyltransferase domain-containing protein [Estrella lausannensis]CRX37904.1 hypothetical protein ELAC_0549 [Estrella lausannensis]
MWQRERSNEQEILDLGPLYYTQEEYALCLKHLSRINQLLGGYRAVRKALKGSNPRSILEVGMGGGGLSRRLSRWFPNASVLGVDINPEAVAYARAMMPQGQSNLSFELQKTKSLPYREGAFDVVTTMLVTHHMDDEELIDFLKESYRIASSLVVINDLQRHLLAYVAFSVVAPLLFPSRLIWHDGRLSIRRSFKRGDWIRLLKKAGFQEGQYKLSWNFPFRWTLTLVKQ